MGIIRPQLRCGNLEIATNVVPGACSDFKFTPSIEVGSVNLSVYTKLWLLYASMIILPLSS